MRKHHWGPCDEGFPIYHQKMLSVALKMKAKMGYQHRWPLFMSLNATLRGANGMECIEGSHSFIMHRTVYQPMKTLHN